MRAAAYTRVSTQAQATEEKVSLEQQRSHVQAIVIDAQLTVEPRAVVP